MLGHGDNYLREGFFFVSFVASNRAPRDPLLIRKGHHDCEVCPPQGDAGSDAASPRPRLAPVMKVLDIVCSAFDVPGTPESEHIHIATTFSAMQTKQELMFSATATSVNFSCPSPATYFTRYEHSAS